MNKITLPSVLSICLGVVIFADISAPSQAEPFVCPTEDVIPRLMENAEAFDNAVKEERWDDLRVLLERIESVGDAYSLYVLSGLYSAGYGGFPSKDARNQRIVDLMTKAAFCGYHHAIWALAGMYEHGDFGLEVDEDMKRCIIERAARHGLPITVCGIPAPEIDR